jgi:predicted RNA binding protein with dsRBD fold (UPF0201 family)
MKRLTLFLSVIIVMVSAVLCQQIIANSVANQQNKKDYAELDHVKYGLFNIDEWKRQVTVILVDEINKIYISRTNERVLRKHIEVLMSTLIDKVDKKIKEGNAGTAGGRLTQSLINMFINMDDIKKGIPEYADAVIHEMTKAKTKRQIKAALNKQLAQYAEQTFNTQDNSQLSRILLRIDCKDIESARINLKEKISLANERIAGEVFLWILLSVILYLLSGFSKSALTPARYLLLVAALVILLSAGVTTPMIDMEAKISQIDFMLMGHAIHFENQVMYFQSKSILDVFRIMITHRDIQMKLVGVLLITFSIIFPLLKLASTFGYYFNYRNARENPLIKFFVLSSGKWSMADVMVVAIFMAYIGFNGIIADQLGQLNTENEDFVLITTNGTALQPGYYLFLTYTLLALFLSELLTRKPASEPALNTVMQPLLTDRSI